MRTFLIVAVLMAAAACARAEGPTSQPAEVGDISVLVLPFSPIGQSNLDWLGQAVQANLVSELARSAGVMPLTPSTNPAGLVDMRSAKVEADKAAAAVVLYGTYQATEEGIRINGQILDARTNRLIGGLKATGTIKEIFAVEDQIAEQARRVLTRRHQVVAAAAAAPAGQARRPVLPAQVLTPVGPRRNVWPWDAEDPALEFARDRTYSSDYGPSYYNYMYAPYTSYYGYPIGFYVAYPTWSGFHSHHREFSGHNFFHGGGIGGHGFHGGFSHGGSAHGGMIRGGW